MANPNFPNNPGYNLYVGARYVPVFANPIDWDSTRTYEPLTVVTYQGNSYTSKTFVPTGIAITNTTYWALTGNYNAQVEQYRQEVNEYSSQSANYFAWTNNLVQWLNGKNILIIGASNETYNYSWAYKLKTALNGIANVTVNAVAGRTLTGANGGAQVFVNNINNYDVFIIATIRNDYWSNVPISIGNDSAGYDQINSALYQMYYAVANTANKKVFFLSMFWGPTSEELTNGDYKFSWTAYQLNLKNKCDRYGFNFLDANKFGGCYLNREHVYIDQRHFSEAANETICKNVLNAIITDKNDGVWSVDSVNVTSQITNANNFVFDKVTLYYTNSGYRLYGNLHCTDQLNADQTYTCGYFGYELFDQIGDITNGSPGTAAVTTSYANRFSILFGFGPLNNAPIYIRPNSVVNANDPITFLVTGIPGWYINRTSN